MRWKQLSHGDKNSMTAYRKGPSESALRTYHVGPPPFDDTAENETSPCPPPLIGFEIEVGQYLLDSMGKDSPRRGAEALTRAHHRLSGCDRKNPENQANEFDSDGFRCYPDHEHFELSGPLVASAVNFVLAQRKARKKLARCKDEAEKSVGPMRVHFDNTNRHGTAWGFHINALISRHVFQRWAEKDWRVMHGQYLPFLAASPVLWGAGKLGAEKGGAPALFQLSQRSDFMDRIVGLETVHSKSLINVRDEPLASPRRYARFHIIAFDTNRAEFASFLKAGVTQLVLALLSEWHRLPDLALTDPLRAMATISRDLSLSVPLRKVNGGETTALEIQYRLAECCGDAIDDGSAVAEVPDAKTILDLWIRTLDDLAQRRPRIVRRLDWRARLELLRRAGHSRRDERALEAADLAYGELGGLFDSLEASGAMECLEDFLPGRSWSPASFNQREAVRARLLSLFDGAVVTADWNRVVIQSPRGVRWDFRLDDPSACGRLLDLVQRSGSRGDCLQRLSRTGFAEALSLASEVPTIVAGTQPWEDPINA